MVGIRKVVAMNTRECTSLSCATSVRMGDVTLDTDSTHPNWMPFKGTLLYVDEASQQPPHGSEGHQIFVSKKVAEERLKTLPGMAVNIDDDLEGHNPKKKIGVIQKAWLDGKRVNFAGIIWKKDFPQEASLLKRNRGGSGLAWSLGMCM